MRRRIVQSLALLIALGLGFVGCAEDNPPADSTSPSDTATADGESGGDTAGPSDGGPDTGADADTAAADDADSGDTGTTKPDLDGGAVALVHRPPKCSLSTQTCSLTVSPDMQTGLKAQVLRDGNGVQGETVAFEIVSGSDLAAIDPNEQPTDPIGRAGVQLNTGSDAGMFRVKANVKFRDTEPIFWDVTIE